MVRPEYRSVIRGQVIPPSVVFHTPPPVVPIQYSMGRCALPATATERPPRGGPTSRQRSAPNAAVAYGAAPCAAARWAGTTAAAPPAAARQSARATDGRRRGGGAARGTVDGTRASSCGEREGTWCWRRTVHARSPGNVERGSRARGWGARCRGPRRRRCFVRTRIDRMTRIYTDL